MKVFLYTILFLLYAGALKAQLSKTRYNLKYQQEERAFVRNNKIRTIFTQQFFYEKKKKRLHTDKGYIKEYDSFGNLIKSDGVIYVYKDSTLQLKHYCALNDQCDSTIFTFDSLNRVATRYNINITTQENTKILEKLYYLPNNKLDSIELFANHPMNLYGSKWGPSFDTLAWQFTIKYSYPDSNTVLETRKALGNQRFIISVSKNGDTEKFCDTLREAENYFGKANCNTVIRQHNNKGLVVKETFIYESKGGYPDETRRSTNQYRYTYNKKGLVATRVSEDSHYKSTMVYKYTYRK